MRVHSLVAIALGLLASCSADPPLGEGEGEGEGTGEGEGEGEEGEGEQPVGACVSAVAVAEFFASQSCTSCHSGGAFPDLRFSAFEALVNAGSLKRPGQQLVVPGDPASSELFIRMAGPRPADYPGPWWMPAGTEGPNEASVVETWINEGAAVFCNGGVAAPPQESPSNPNDLDAELLFQCADPTSPQSSPARLRRIGQMEFAFGAANPPDAELSQGLVANNPLTSAGQYSTHTGALSIDETTLELMLGASQAASRSWQSRGNNSAAGSRIWTPYNRLVGNAVYDDFPFDEDVGNTVLQKTTWIDTMLRQAVLYRTPLPEELALIESVLDEQLANETVAADRAETLQTVIASAYMLVGGMFRSEMGQGAVDGQRRRLSDEELGLALGRVIGAHPVSSTLWGAAPPADSTHPDWSRADIADGHLAAIRDAVNNGTIAAELVPLLHLYRGGVDPYRVDVTTELRQSGNHEVIRKERGEYVLSQGLTEFFREWLEVQGAEGVFKDTPHATSAFATTSDDFVQVDRGYDQLTSIFRREGLLTSFDDTVARAVVEAEQSGQDAFAALMTTRMFRVPSDLATTNGNCNVRADCPGSHPFCDSTGGQCYSGEGMGYISGVFGVGDVADTQQGRWVSLPQNERSGVLTHPAFLAAHGGNFEDDANLILRGRWVRENLLCNDVPGLELVGVPAQLQERSPDLRARDRVRNATEQPGSQCLACHQEEINPYGYPFEIYNHAGFLRASDHGLPPDGSSTVNASQSTGLNGTYANAIDFTAAVAASPDVRRCFVRNVFRFFMGRNETLADACTLTQLEDAFAGGSVFALLDALVTSDVFLYRSDTVGGEP